MPPGLTPAATPSTPDTDASDLMLPQSIAAATAAVATTAAESTASTPGPTSEYSVGLRRSVIYWRGVKRDAFWYVHVYELI